MATQKRSLVIIPTYNEAENIKNLISEILSQGKNIEVLVVDDNSSDGTSKIVKTLHQKTKKVHLIEREKKMGLGTAYIAGFKYALHHGFDYIFEMDADFSHDPKEIPNFLYEIQKYDLVIGSRYINGVSVVHWPIRRLLLSYFANKYTHWITGLPLRDATAGFKCFRRVVLENIKLDNVKSNGYSFQIEMNFKTWWKGFNLKEIPITFVDRRRGLSKMNRKIVWEAVFMVWKIRLRAIFNRL
ncbi:MAG: polyprenol monophosphomannose synthase [Bacteroidetes bacterium]|nr:polyprenol monophosphomannose synthase [Bacteroidota bacterium]